MTDVFVSSVVAGFEDYRAAARRAVELLGFRPLMSETFGARPYSSEVACVTEVQRSDVYVIVLGRTYGYVTHGGLSVTHTEYRTARSANKPILAFVQDCDMDARQLAFTKEVEAYQSGVFRQTFSSPEELKDEIVRALRQWETGKATIPTEEFERRIDGVLSQTTDRHRSYPELVLSFLPQPAVRVDVIAVEKKLDDLFQKLCNAGIAVLRNGYEPDIGETWSGVVSDLARYTVFNDGLRMLRTSPAQDRESKWGSQFVAPDFIRNVASGYAQLLPVGSGFAELQMRGMRQAFVAQAPTGNSMSMRLDGDDRYQESHFLNPATHAAFDDWIGHVVNALQRRYRYPPR